MTQTDETTELRLTHGIFRALLSVTGGDVELHQPKKRALVRKLHAVAFEAKGHYWVLRLTEEEQTTLYHHLVAYLLNRPEYRSRYLGAVVRQSPFIRALVEADDAAARKLA